MKRQFLIKQVILKKHKFYNWWCAVKTDMLIYHAQETSADDNSQNDKLSIYWW